MKKGWIAAGSMAATYMAGQVLGLGGQEGEPQSSYAIYDCPGFEVYVDNGVELALGETACEIVVEMESAFAGDLPSIQIVDTSEYREGERMRFNATLPDLDAVVLSDMLFEIDMDTADLVHRHELAHVALERLISRDGYQDDAITDYSEQAVTPEAEDALNQLEEAWEALREYAPVPGVNALGEPDYESDWYESGPWGVITEGAYSPEGYDTLGHPWHSANELFASTFAITATYREDFLDNFIGSPAEEQILIMDALQATRAVIDINGDDNLTSGLTSLLDELQQPEEA